MGCVSNHQPLASQSLSSTKLSTKPGGYSPCQAKQKLRAMRSPDGLTGYGVARIAPFFPKLMWSEGFSAVGSPEEHARQLWPHDYTTFWYVHAAVTLSMLPDIF
ncbi:hypothetical protein HYC85_025882 [Camellia sinensis]|uniref:Uncharacterized protein n=1 Tax=Camellia sinensis TaxID=4442 RepID=A0A7J7G205_CAMSI|nr:hypothetical protein HYC85_025882 [Camellia sinensis]